MRHVNGVDTQRFNRRHGVVGHLFQRRFKAILVDRDAYLLALCRCVERKLVAAGMVQAAGAGNTEQRRRLRDTQAATPAGCRLANLPTRLLQ